MHVVLVHGSGGSAESWSSVVPLLEDAGIPVTVSDTPSQSLHDDVATVTRLIDGIDGPVLLVGHSYGGSVITGAGTHPRVRGLVYIAAWVPDEGENVRELVERYPQAEVGAWFTRGEDGSWIPDDSPAAREALAWDVPIEVWERRIHDRRPSADAIFTERSGPAAWRTRPAWYLIALDDKHIHLEGQQHMAARAGARTRTVATSHAVPYAAPRDVVDIIEAARSSLTG
ncbi:MULTISPECIES: alpha/beta fold hydrolase [Microbacterium]|jgi:pimeloyl-ACP methyl ester carboxylesterase|uniref:alpha/beta fold hydrolase n=1 Tax=Microbacterium TaxID=33882 RepID=UPI001D17D1B5|nr:alpha/beta hydrolase [Microbacterium testaceum]MCC4248665.1 alpha/beta hydrolase [Microbacterium testaceum]